MGDKRYIGLIFRAPDEKQGGFGTVKFIGKNDSLENALITAEHIGKECVALIEMDRLESSFLDASRGKRRSSMMRVQEAICSKIGAAVLQAE
ncbi:MAG: hypothetical protein Q8O59_01930 [bacterium]|nr:hypothetical protein [bacterium]